MKQNAVIIVAIIKRVVPRNASLIGLSNVYASVEVIRRAKKQIANE